MNFYVVLEIQGNSETPAILSNIYTDKNTAYNKYYTVLSFAAVSQLSYHSAYIIGKDNEGDVFEYREFTH